MVMAAEKKEVDMSREEFFERAYSERTGCGGPLYLACVLMIIILML